MTMPKGDIIIVTAPCWKCEKDMLIALIGDDAGHFGGGPEEFTEEEKRLAEQNGVLLKIVHSNMAEENYLANVCKACGAFFGKFYLFDFYSEALYGEYEYTILKVNSTA